MIVLYAILAWIIPIILTFGIKYLRLPKDSTLGDLFEEGWSDPPTFTILFPVVNVFILIIYTGMSIVESLTAGDLSKIKIK